jgi:hypothetical protein
MAASNVTLCPRFASSTDVTIATLSAPPISDAASANIMTSSEFKARTIYLNENVA